MDKGIEIYSEALVRLLKGVIYSDRVELWNMVMDYQNRIRDYFRPLGVTLVLNEREGYAYLESAELEETELPTLFSKAQLSYPVTMLCLLLLERLLEFEHRGGEEPFLVVNEEEMVEMVKLFLADRSNEARLVDSIESHINRLVDYGFLRRLKKEGTEYEVRSILKSKIDADKIVEIKERLVSYESI